MLITFRVANFLSFNEEEEFSMLAGKQRKPVRPAVPLATGVEALKLAVIYGANASGKSNLVRSIDFAKKVIINGMKNVSYFENHFRLQKGNKEKPSKFEFELELDGKNYAYGFAINLNTSEVVEEWLFDVKKTTQKPIFERIISKSGASNFKSKPSLKNSTETRFSIYAEDIQSHELLLNVLGTKQWPENSFFSIFQLIYNWFQDSLIIFYTDSKISLHNFIDSDDGRNFLGQMLKKMGTGITEVDLIAESTSQIFFELSDIQRIKIINGIDNGRAPSLILGGKRYVFTKNSDGDIVVLRTQTKHQGLEQSLNDFDFEDESDGTKRLFDLIPLIWILKQPAIGFTVVVDEIDRSLHPELLHKIIEFYLESSKAANSQLIVTTHESSLLDLSLLRRDEVWFVEKNKKGESHLYSLEEFQPRFDKEIRKAYLQGRYGAIPFISDVQQLNWETANAEG